MERSWPPTSSICSSTSVSRANSSHQRAADKPAGPAPMMITSYILFLGVFLYGFATLLEKAGISREGAKTQSKTQSSIRIWRLVEIRNARDFRIRKRLQFQLLNQKFNPIAARVSVEVV